MSKKSHLCSKKHKLNNYETENIFAFLLLLVVGLQSVKAQEAYAVYNNGTLTFYYDKLRSSRPGTTYDMSIGDASPGWWEQASNVTSAVFNSSFAYARPTSTHDWFSQMENLQSITGMEYLNTSKVTDMAYMFNHCSSLTSLDLSNFNTGKVTNMNTMFWGCGA